MEVAMEKFLTQLLDNAPDAILIADGAGIISYWNHGAERIFGYSAAVAIGASLDLIIPAPLRGRHWQGYQRVMAEGTTRYQDGLLLSVPGARHDNSRLSLEFSMVLLRDDAGLMAGCAAILRDVTARRQEEQELKTRLARCENERQG
jgi:PAS domain S-box-containing protein